MRATFVGYLFPGVRRSRGPTQMINVPDPVWPVIALAVFFVGDALGSINPPKLIRECLEGVGFPLEWRWALVWVKLVAAAGLIVGIWQPGVGVAATAGAIAYFLAATYAHLRARFHGITFASCLTMLACCVGVLLISFVF